MSDTNFASHVSTLIGGTTDSFLVGAGTTSVITQKTAAQVRTLLDVLTSSEIASAYQPLDADLTSIAALSGTNTIYYRSGAATWSAVTIGSGLTFSTGTLSASGGSGITTLNTLTGATQTFATGTTGTDFAISSSGTTHTFNIPSANASNRGLVTTGTQTFAGVKTFSGNTVSASLTVNNSNSSNTGLDVRPWVQVKNNSATLAGYLSNGASIFSSEASGSTDLGVRAVGAFGVSVNNSTTPCIIVSSAGATTITTASASVVPVTFKGAPSQTANLSEWQNSSATVLSTVSENGYFTTRKVAAPADGELSSSEVAFWFDDTNGAAKLKIKGKSANGTVVTGEVALV